MSSPQSINDGPLFLGSPPEDSETEDQIMSEIDGNETINLDKEDDMTENEIEQPNEDDLAFINDNEETSDEEPLQHKRSKKRNFEIYEDDGETAEAPVQEKPATKKARRKSKKQKPDEVTELSHVEATILHGWPAEAVKQANELKKTAKDSSKTPFRMRCRFALITWSRCDMPPKDFIEELRKKNIFPDRYIACQEQHKLRGNPDAEFGEIYKEAEKKERLLNTKDKRFDTKHIHALFDIGTTDCGKPRQINSCRVWDMFWNGRTYHPNIGRVKSLHAAWKYICKREDPKDIVFTDNDRHCHFDDPSDKKTQHGTKHTVWHTIIQQETETEMRKALTQLAPERYMCANNGIEAYLARRFPTQSSDTFRLPTGTKRLRPRRINLAEKWKEIFIEHPRKGRQLCLWILGASLTGKSSWARLIGRHYMMKGEFNPKTFHENVDYYVLDDFRPERIQYNELIQGTEFCFDGKYCPIQTYKGGQNFGKEGIPVIWTSNFHPWDQKDEHRVNKKRVDLEWLKQNVLLLDIGKQKMSLAPNEEDKIYELDPEKTSIPDCWYEYLQQYDEERERKRVLFWKILEILKERRIGAEQRDHTVKTGFQVFAEWIKKRLAAHLTKESTKHLVTEDLEGETSSNDDNSLYEKPSMPKEQLKQWENCMDI